MPPLASVAVWQPWQRAARMGWIWRAKLTRSSAPRASAAAAGSHSNASVRICRTIEELARIIQRKGRVRLVFPLHATVGPPMLASAHSLFHKGFFMFLVRTTVLFVFFYL